MAKRAWLGRAVDEPTPIGPTRPGKVDGNPFCIWWVNSAEKTHRRIVTPADAQVDLDGRVLDLQWHHSTAGEGLLLLVHGDVNFSDVTGIPLDALAAPNQFHPFEPSAFAFSMGWNSTGVHTGGMFSRLMAERFGIPSEACYPPAAPKADTSAE